MAQKKYILDMFPYPSGAGLHVGHVEGYTATDILSRYLRMNGYEVLHPMGWDSFGLPAENYAIKTGVKPAITTENAIATFKEQMNHMGFSYDWSREIGAHRPDYYKWTQWLFTFLYEKGLAYRAKAPVNWCPSCQTVLANEQVVEGKCERCDTPVIQKEMEQWFFKITAYADRLLADLDKIDWPESTKIGQRNWIGRSEGVTINFILENENIILPIWTKFWETVFGTTFVVIAPEKFLQLQLDKYVSSERKNDVAAYINAAQHKTEQERRIGEKEKTGVNTGLYVINPVNGSRVPLFIADYVLLGVGTAIVMGVPAHDERDFTFAKKFDLPIQQVVQYEDKDINEKVAKGEAPYEGEGILINSDIFNGKSAWGEGKQEMKQWIEEKGFGKKQITYRLRDWLVSRQRYWGAPVPMVFCEEHKWQSVPLSALPVRLPEDVDFKPTGESPIQYSHTFQQGAVCPVCGKPARREVDTMDTFVDSSWYFMRFADPHNDKEFASAEALKQFLPVDVYVGGAEHTVLHLLYSRFITKVLYDYGYVTFDEPFLKLRHQGIILAEDHRKMSKRWGNVINPDDEIKKYGADTVRMYEMFMGPLKDMKAWDTKGVQGVYRFLNRVIAASSKVADKKVYSEEQEKRFHKTLQFVTLGVTNFQFNTCISSFMELLNELQKHEAIDRSVWEGYLKIMAPFAPFTTENLWKKLGNTTSVHEEKWPEVNRALLQETTKEIPVLVNGKVRGTITLGLEDNEAKAMEAAQKNDSIAKHLSAGKIQKVVYVKGKILNVLTA